MKTYEPMGGENIEDTCKTLEKMAAEHNETVTAEFNGVTITAEPGMTAGDLHQAWHEEFTRRQEAYRASPEYKRKQEEFDRQDRERKEALQQSLANAPPMDRINDIAWEQFSANNTDPYGARVVRYAEEWARLMQVKIADGQTVKECADWCSGMADDDGITGFMYGCAVSILAQVWKHGEELRRWHNLKTQIGREGEKANESGGVLNPALLSLQSED